MLKHFRRHSIGTLTYGFALGLMFGLGILVGSATLSGDSNVQLPPVQLNATATNSSNSFAMATGPVTSGMEGVFFLDYLTGELQGWVMNPRNARLGGRFRHNVIQDLGVEQGKKPKFLMVTGLANFRAQGSNRLSNCVIYVCDANTGRFVAYALPWNRNAANNNVTQIQPMIKIGYGVASSRASRVRNTGGNK